LTITGSGTPDDPYIIMGATDSVQGVTNTNFKVNITGSGTVDSPLKIETVWNTNAKLKNIPDVNVTGVTSGQVLAWDATNQKWVNADPVTAPVGAVQHDGSLSGDGSGAHLLSVVSNSTRGMTTDITNGVSIRDTYINQMVRKFTNATTRDAADPAAETLNTLTILNNHPGQIDFWNGSAWRPIGSGVEVVVANEVMLELSGPYSVGMPLTHLVKRITSDIIDSGNFVILDEDDLDGFSGVLTCMYAAAGSPVVHTNMTPNLPVGLIGGIAYTIGSGVKPPNGYTIHGWIDAWLY
jgi:hypothetical protein